MNWKNKRVLVTGSAGVIGKEVITRLVKKGSVVRCFDIVPKPEVMPPSVEYIQRDLSELNSKEFVVFDPEIIFHLAATFERTAETPEFWDTNFKNNVQLTHKVIEAAKNCKSLQKFLFASSYLVYSPDLYLFDSPPSIPVRLKESDPINPRNLCGASKYYAEKELEFLDNLGYRFTSISARIFRAYGRGSKDVISTWVRACLRGETIEVYGKDNSFDYIFADDVAEGMLKLVENEDARKPVNVGTGTSRKIREVVEILQKEIPDLKIKEIERQAPVEASSADIARLHRLTGGWPSIKLEQGIKNLFNYESERLGEGS